MRVLILEDDANQRRSLVALLRRERFDVVESSELKDALTLLKHEPFEICVLDLKLESENGLNVLRQLTESQIRETSFIVHTGHGTFDAARDALNLGVFAFLEKLSDPSELINQVHRAAAGHLRRSLSQAEEEIRFQVRLLDCVQQAVVATNVQGNIIYWNRFAETLYGWTADEVKGRSVFELIVPGDQRVDGQEIMRQLRAGQSWRGEFITCHRDGRRFPVDVTDSPIFDEHDQLIGIIGVSSDMSDRKRAEEALIASERNYRSVIEASADAIICSSTTSQSITVWNRAAEQMFGYHASEMFGNTVARLVPEHRQHESEQICSQLKAGQPIVDFSTQRLTKDGRLLDVVLNVQPIRDDEGMVDNASATFRDVTEFKRAQEQLRRAERLASVATLAGGIAHEINNPISAAWTSAETALRLFKEATDDELLQDALQTMVGSVKRCDQIVQNVLRLSGTEQSSKTKANVNQLIDHAVSFTSMYANQNGVQIHCEISQAPLVASVNRIEIEQAIINLLKNAIEASATGMHVNIRSALKANCAIVSVQDRGRGIPQAMKEKVFDPFFTHRRNENDSGSGVGLGLCIVHRIVKDHDGTIEVESEEGKGTTVTLELPVFKTRHAVMVD